MYGSYIIINKHIKIIVYMFEYNKDIFKHRYIISENDFQDYQF